MKKQNPTLFFRHCFLYCIYVFTFVPFILGAQTTYTWNGSNSSAWSSNLNWTPSTGYPGLTDNVVIRSFGFVPELDSAHSVASFTITSGTLDLNTLTLSVTGTSSYTGGKITNGNITINSSIATFSGTIFDANVAATCATILLNGSTFNGITHLEKTGSGLSTCQGGNTFNGVTTLISSGSGNMMLSYANHDIFNSDVSFNCTGTGKISIAENGSAATQFNGNILLNSTGSSLGLNFGNNTGTSILTAGKTISIGPAGFSAGTLNLKNFIQLGSTSQAMTAFSDVSVLQLGTGNIFNGDIHFAAPGLYLDGSTFNGNAILEKMGSSYNFGHGGNTFNSNTVIINSSSNELLIGGLHHDVFNGDVTFTNSGSSKMNIAYADGTGTLFNGNIFVNSNGSSLGINFGYGVGTSVLASGKAINIGSDGFSAGTLFIKNFTQLGSTEQIMNSFTGTSTLQLEASTTFNGNVIFSSPQVLCHAVTFNANASIEKTGAGNNNWYGNNIFNGTTTVTNHSIGNLDMANNAGDDFNGDVSFISLGTGRLTPVTNGSSTFAKDISTVGSSLPISFGYTYTSGRTTFDGSIQQSISGDASHPPSIKSLIVNKGSNSILNLNVSVSILTDIAFVTGIVNVTGAGLLILNNGAGISDAADNLSHVNGSVRKIGTGAFTFPTGNNGYYAPIAISAPSLASDHFTAAYFNQRPNSITSKDLILNNVSACEFWSLERTHGTSNVAVTLSWDSRSCGVTTPVDLHIAYWNGSKWTDRGNSGTTGSSSFGTVTSSVLSSFGTFTLASSTASNSLPVELLAFKGACKEQANVLDWQTASENNNKNFSIERSLTGTTWEHISTIDAYGTTSAQHNYSVEDRNIISGETYYYRLKQTDFNDDFKYFDMIAVKACSAIAVEDFTIYPNPTTGNFNIHFNGEINQSFTIEVLNTAGDIVHTSDDNLSSIDLSQFAEGIYFIIINSNTNRIVKKLLLKK